ncbi:MAG: GNAT family N-acetyltransferase [Anaerolineae bacterium]|nr:GNAT family N-acetyltransferase [Anaerolineae bacterium]
MKIAPLSLADQDAWAHLLAVSFNRNVEQMHQLLHFLQPDQRVVAWGAWDGVRLAAQYSCLLTAVANPHDLNPLPVGMSINMAVHPAYRGQGLIKQVSQPVYRVLTERGMAAGVGFSNAAGVKVDQKSKDYGYRVVGQLRPYLAYLKHKGDIKPLCISGKWPEQPISMPKDTAHFRFAALPAEIKHRFAEHPFRRYQFATWQTENCVHGLVIYRPIRLGGLPAVALLAAYGPDLPGLFRRWSRTMCQEGFRLVQLLTTPHSCILPALRQTAVLTPQFKSRTPYYLTLKPLRPDLPPALLDFAQWDCMGGDVL